MTPSKLDLHSLIVFYYVASEESITSAADKLCLTQPTVTYHIRSLERNVGVKLLDMRRQKVFLTRAGDGLFRYVREIYQQMTSAEKFLEDLKEASLRIGISTTFNACLAQAVSCFEKLYPRVKLSIRSSSSFEVVDDVLNSRVDLGIAVGMDYGKPKLRAITLSGPQKLVFVASPASAIAQRKHLSVASLSGCPLILGPETSATRQIVIKKIRNNCSAVSASIVTEVNNPEWGINLIANGEGIGLYHMKSVQKDIAEGRLKELLLSADITVVAGAILRADAPEHPMAQRFLSLARESFQADDDRVPAGIAVVQEQ